ncbi:MAG: glutamyl-tRNA reductase [Bacteroidetes bacterium]|jgi:glutamyl-tRNA reductase|nr:glutamyl-tRNA reductase [Bacteroidota bacterium]
MHISRPTKPDNFFVAGISYKKTDAATRGQFALSHVHYDEVLKLAPQFGLDALFILSTCNRTEIYGFADNASQLIDLLCTQTTGDAETFTKLAYCKQGDEAIAHLFKVGAGLDSQILGDYEIVGQLKQAVKFAKDRNFINSFMERLVNSVLQASKSVKSDTALSGGTVSASYAAVQYIKENVTSAANKKILLIGTGKIGRNTCKNLVDYLGATDITLINRTDERAIELAKELNLHYAPMAGLALQVAAADIILAATNADEPILLKEHLENKGNKLIIDLSIPYNVATDASRLSNIKLVNVDTLSKIKDEALQQRAAETPKALQIIAEHQANFMEWYRMHLNAPMLQSIKAMLNKIAVSHQHELNNPHTRCPYIAAEQKIQQIMNSIAGKMRNESTQGCYYIEAINEYMSAVAVKNKH